MPRITGLTAERMAVIEGQSVVSGQVVGDNLFLTRQNGSQINAGNVRGPQGIPGTGGGGGGGGGSGTIDGSYEPAVPFHWNGATPTSISQALDMLAARIHEIERYNHVILLNDAEPVPGWVRTTPETVVMYRPPA